ncbi:MAG: hypothetical protein IPO19_14665 [Rhodoferax sp.]|nr:hypothetical protein [Rhodoferax sp.]
MQLKVRRVSLHLAVAQVMQTYYRERLDEFAGLIAYHYEAAQEFSIAAQHLARAARWIGTTDSAQAGQLWRKVWECRKTSHGQPLPTACVPWPVVVSFTWTGARA